MDGETGGGLGIGINIGIGGAGCAVEDYHTSDARAPDPVTSPEPRDDDDGEGTAPASMSSRRRPTAPRSPRSDHSSPVGHDLDLDLDVDTGCLGDRSRRPPLPLRRGRRLLTLVAVLLSAAATTGVVVLRWSRRLGRYESHGHPPFQQLQQPPTRLRHPRRILVVGLIEDLGDLLLPPPTTDAQTGKEEGEDADDGEDSSRRSFVGNGVVEGLVGLCSSATIMRRDSDEDDGEDGGDGDGGFGVDVHVTYRSHDGRSSSGTRENGENVADALRGILLGGGCLRVHLEKEEGVVGEDGGEGQGQGMSRYQRLARLRSKQRARILSENRGYDVVVNVDLDVLSLPPVSVMLDAVENAVRVSSSSFASTGHNGDEGEGGHGGGAVVCANGYETWPFLRWMRLYYDTLASVDPDGEWYYQSYSLDPLQVVTFGQARLFRRMSEFTGTDETKEEGRDDGERRRSATRLWPMRSCFGGMAVYDYATWSAEPCDYNRDGITLLLDSDNKEDDVEAESEDDVVAADSKGGGMRRNVVKYWRPSGRYTRDGTSIGDACEHVVFQMCLAAMHRNGGDGGGGNERMLTVGIQPDLVVGREANFSVSLTEDWARVSKGAAIVVFPILVVLFVVKAVVVRLHRRGLDVEAADMQTKEMIPILGGPPGKDKEG